MNLDGRPRYLENIQIKILSLNEPIFMCITFQHRFPLQRSLDITLILNKFDCGNVELIMIMIFSWFIIIIIIIIIIGWSGHYWPMVSPTSIFICSLFLSSLFHLLISQYHLTIAGLPRILFALGVFSLPICHFPFFDNFTSSIISKISYTPVFSLIY